jgi:thiol:disulfide interchange protein
MHLNNTVYMKYFFFLCLFILGRVTLFAQDAEPKDVDFTLIKERINNKEAVITIKALPKAGVKLFSQHIVVAKDSALFTEVTPDTSLLTKYNGSIEEKGVFVDTIDKASDNLRVRYSTEEVQWIQKLNVSNTDSFKLNIAVNYGYYKNGTIKYNEENLKTEISASALKASKANSKVSGEPTNNEEGSLLGLWFTGLLAGLLALLTPCVYSMLPITVSFFTKKSKTRAEGIRNAFVYALSIILIFVALGGGLSAAFGSKALQDVSTHWFTNGLIFVLFVIFGISFLGAFEIQLPNKWSNAADGKANNKSIMGIFFMALTLVIVSFSCTGPFVTTMLANSTSSGRLGPTIGMLGFSMGLALPFFIFALIPNTLNKLSKAGGWQNTLKVTLGFLEIAFALKFLSNVDQQFGWGLLNRDVYIVLWIVLFGVLGLYLLGKFKLPKDSELPNNDFGLPHITVTRLMFALISLSFAIYLIPGLWGASLKPISGFLPPYGTQSFNINSVKTVSHTNANTSSVTAPQKYASLFETQHPEAVSKYGLRIFNDYDEALQAAKKENKAVFVDFTGINCVNCRKFENDIWLDETVGNYMRDSFVVASLYTDATSSNYDLPEAEHFDSKELSSKVTTIGAKFGHIQSTLDNGKLATPAYLFVNGEGKKIAEEAFYYSSFATPKDFIKYMDKILEAKRGL